MSDKVVWWALLLVFLSGIGTGHNAILELHINTPQVYTYSPSQGLTQQSDVLNYL